MTWYLVVYSNMVAKLGFTPGFTYKEVSDWLEHIDYSGQNFNKKMYLHDSVFNVTWSNFLRDAWAPSQTPVPLVTR